MISSMFAFFMWFLFATSASQRLMRDEIGSRRDLQSTTFASFLSNDEHTKLKAAYEGMFSPYATNHYSWENFKTAWATVFSNSDYTAWGADTKELSDLATTSDELKKYNLYRMITFFWAHMAQETGKGAYVKEASCSGTTTDSVCCSYNEKQTDCGKGDDYKYFGRGAFQISHDKNYRAFGAWLRNNGHVADSQWTSWGCDNVGSFEGCADKLATADYAFLSGMWYFKVTGMNLCGGSTTESVLHCFKRSIYLINGQQECVATYGSNSHGYHNLGWGKCTQSGNEITNQYIWKGYMNTPYGQYGYGQACRQACSAESSCTGYNFSEYGYCLLWTASPIDGKMYEPFYGWGNSFCWKKMPLRLEAASRINYLKNAITKFGVAVNQYAGSTDTSCDFCDTFKTSNEPHKESPCFDDSNY